MHIGFHLISKNTDVKLVVIECPVCGKVCKSARAKDMWQLVLLLYVIPVFYHSPTLVECSCGALLVSRAKARDLQGMDAASAGRCLSKRTSPVLKAMVFGGVIAWFIPVIGIIWTGITYWWARRYSGWIRKFAFGVLLLSFLSTAGMLLAAFVSSANVAPPHKRLRPSAAVAYP